MIYCVVFVGLTWILVYRTDKYKKLKAEVEKQSKKCTYNLYFVSRMKQVMLVWLCSSVAVHLFSGWREVVRKTFFVEEFGQKKRKNCVPKFM